MSVLFEIVQADASASVQDLGRRRSTQHGVTEGGAADIHAAMWANCLLGRNPAEPLVEITIGLFAVEFKVNCQIAITGGDLDASLNGVKINNWQTHNISDGDHLQFGAPITGIRGYLAINARLELEPIFASVSTVARESLGGLCGADLQVGEQLIGEVINSGGINRTVPTQFIPDYAAPLQLQLIASYQFEQFPKTAIDAVLTGEYQIQNSSNRTAYALSGKAIEHTIDKLGSEGIAYGAVQIPPDGQPIVLLNDRQTMGGYPKLGCISRLSGAALAQRFHPNKVTFSLCSAATAAAEYHAHLSFFTGQSLQADEG